MAKVKNLDKVIKQLNRVAPQSKIGLRGAVVENAEAIKTLAQHLAPKGKTGWLSRSIVVRKLSRADQSKVADPNISRRVVVLAWYARLVEFGTPPHLNKGMFPGTQHPGTRPRPFFFPAYRALGKNIRVRGRQRQLQALRKAVAT
jgi:HK97 gp10 family phage protein